MKFIPVSAAESERLILRLESAVLRLPGETIAIAAAREPKMTRNIIASTAATPRSRGRGRRGCRVADAIEAGADV